MSEDRTSILTFLAAHNTMTLATLSEGKPWASAVFYVHDEDFNLFFITSPDTRRGVGILQNNEVAATIQADGQDWNEISGLQLTGTCRLAEDKDLARINDLYLEKFSFLRYQDGNVADPAKRELARRLDETPYFCFQPNWIRLIDNAQGFGHKIEITLDD